MFAACVLAPAQATAGIIVINFDDVTAPALFINQNTQLTNQYSSLGVTFTSPPTQDANEILNSSTFTVPAAATSPNLLASLGSRIIEGFFSVPVYSVGALIGISAGQDTLNIYDASNNLISSILGDDVFVSLSSATPISRFTVVATNSDTPAIDNLTFDASVPEPATIALMCLGLAGIGFARKKKQAA